MYVSITDLIRWFRGNNYKRFSKFEVLEETLRYLFGGDFVYDFELCIKNIKWRRQRAKRGWADCDIWDMYAYLGKVISEMLIEMKRIQHDYPTHLTEYIWDYLVDQMISGFQLVADQDNDFISIEGLEGKPRELLEVKYAKEIRNNKKLERSLELFKKNFLNLCD